MNRTEKIALALFVILFLLALALFLPDHDKPRIGKFLIVSQIFGAAYLALVWLQHRGGLDSGRYFWRVIIPAALTLRILLLVGGGTRSYLSDDVYRYVWDGRMVNNGINVYQYAPEDKELSSYRDHPIWPKVNHPWLPTIYPPAAQIAFAFAALLSTHSLWGMKVLLALCDLVTIILLFDLLKYYHRPRSDIVIYLFSPIVLFEFYLSFHVDLFSLPLLVIGLTMIRLRKPLSAGIMLAGATLVKLMTGFFILPLVRAQWPFQWRFALGFITTAGVLYLPYLFNMSVNPFGSLFVYLAGWQFNGSAYFLLKYAAGLGAARYLTAGLLLLSIILLLWRRREVTKTMLAIFIAYIVFTTTIFPWYLVIALPFLILHKSRALLVLSVTIFLSYHVLIGYYESNVWSVYPRLGLFEYIPFYILLAYDLLRGWPRRRLIIETEVSEG